MKTIMEYFAFFYRLGKFVDYFNEYCLIKDFLRDINKKNLDFQSITKRFKKITKLSFISNIKQVEMLSKDLNDFCLNTVTAINSFLPLSIMVQFIMVECYYKKGKESLRYKEAREKTDIRIKKCIAALRIIIKHEFLLRDNELIWELFENCSPQRINEELKKSLSNKNPCEIHSTIRKTDDFFRKFGHIMDTTYCKELAPLFKYGD